MRVLIIIRFTLIKHKNNSHGNVPWEVTTYWTIISSGTVTSHREYKLYPCVYNIIINPWCKIYTSMYLHIQQQDSF